MYDEIRKLASQVYGSDIQVSFSAGIIGEVVDIKRGDDSLFYGTVGLAQRRLREWAANSAV